MSLGESDEFETDSMTLVNFMDGVLAGVVAAFEQQNVELPARQYWTLAQPAADCEQLVVSFLQLFLGVPGDQGEQAQNCNSPRSASLQIMILRCIPASGPRGQPPTAVAIQNASEPMAVDAWVLMQAAAGLDQWDPAGGRGLGLLATVNAMEPQGGFQGVNLLLTLGVP